MGGGDFPVQQTIEHIEVEHDEGVAHDIFHEIGDFIGWWPLLLIVFIAIAARFRKKIKKWIMKA